MCVCSSARVYSLDFYLVGVPAGAKVLYYMCTYAAAGIYES